MNTSSGERNPVELLAEDFLDRMDAWAPYAFSSDPSIAFYEPLYRSGEIKKAELDRQRAEKVVSNFRRPVVLEAIDTCVVDVPFVIEEWQRRGVGRHEVDVFSFRIPARG